MGTALLRLLVRMSTASKTHPSRGHPIAPASLLLMHHQWSRWSHLLVLQQPSPYRRTKNDGVRDKLSFERTY